VDLSARSTLDHRLGERTRLAASPFLASWVVACPNVARAVALAIAREKSVGPL
jgi:hypothetical protein